MTCLRCCSPLVLFVVVVLALALALCAPSAVAFAPLAATSWKTTTTTTTTTTSIGRLSTFASSSPFALHVSIGLGPQEQNKTDETTTTTKQAGVDYEIPNHQDFRQSRRSKIDGECDAWFATLLDGPPGCLGKIAQEAKTKLLTPVPLINTVEKEDRDDQEWTPYVNTKLPWTPLVPAYGTEVFGIPVPRRNAETWRHFDVPGLVRKTYPLTANNHESRSTEDTAAAAAVKSQLQAQGVWLNDEACQGRLVYVNGWFVPELSKTTDWIRNLDAAPPSRDNGGDKDSDDEEDSDNELATYLDRLTDGFTDELAVPVPCNDAQLTSYKKLSGPHHALGEPFSQFAINAQQGTACFAALNTYKTVGVALVQAPQHHDATLDTHQTPQPVLIIHAQTNSGGGGPANHQDQQQEGGSVDGVAQHPRTVVVAEQGARLSVVQSSVTIDDTNDTTTQQQAHRPKLVNGYTQVFVKKDANVTHSYLEESAGMVTPGVEKADHAFGPNQPTARSIEAARPELQDAHLQAIDVHVVGEAAAYQGTVMAVGGAGHVRVALSVSLLQPQASAVVNGFCLAGGAQRTDMKTNIHHVAQGTTSQQLQKNMIGGRATGSFRGRIRVEQSAQQTDSEQLSRTILLSDKARGWTVPSLEIIADDVQCAHGATVADLSEEEMFYLRSRGLDTTMARNMLMYAFAEDVATNVDPSMLGTVDGQEGLQKRIIRRLENVVPQGERAVKGEFQSI